MAAPPLVPDDAPTTPIRVADLRRAARHAHLHRSPRRWVSGVIAAAVVVTLIVVGVTVAALRSGPAGTGPVAAPLPTTSPSAPSAPTPSAVPVGGILLQLTAAPSTASISADGSIVGVLDDVSGAAGQRTVELTTYDQTTGAQLAVAGPGMPEILECGVGVVARPDGTSVVLTRYDTETAANGVQLGSRQAHLTARDGRSLRPLWDVVLHAGDSNDSQLINDTVCNSTSIPSYQATADGRYVLNRSFDVSRLIDLATGAVRPVPFAVNVVGNDVVVAVPPPDDGGTPPAQTGPSTVEAVRLVSASDLRVQSTITDEKLVTALDGVGAPGHATLTGFVTPSGSDSRFSISSLSGDARTLAVREDKQIALVDLPSGRTRSTVPLDPASVGDANSDPLAIIPGTTPAQDVLLVGLPMASDGPAVSTGFTAYDLAGHRLWSLPRGAARTICGIDRGTLLMAGSGLATVDPLTGHQLAVDQNGNCPQLVAGLAVTAHQDSSVSSTAEYTVRVLRRP